MPRPSEQRVIARGVSVESHRPPSALLTDAALQLPPRRSRLRVITGGAANEREANGRRGDTAGRKRQERSTAHGVGAATRGDH